MMRATGMWVVCTFPYISHATCHSDPPYPYRPPTHPLTHLSAQITNHFHGCTCVCECVYVLQLGHQHENASKFKIIDCQSLFFVSQNQRLTLEFVFEGLRYFNCGFLSCDAKLFPAITPTTFRTFSTFVWMLLLLRQHFALFISQIKLNPKFSDAQENLISISS